jgi:hypothetical protein
MRHCYVNAMAGFALLGAMLASAGDANAQVSGAVFTTKSDGATVDQNLYDNGNLVYLNGGPQNTNAGGLSDGVYFFQVTTPSGKTLLSTTNALDRLVLIQGGKFYRRCDSFANTLAEPVSPHPHGTYNSANGSTPVQLWPFNLTTNQGGEYKAWIVRSDHATVDPLDAKVIHFSNRDAKTDNFKIRSVNVASVVSIGGRKFYDRNFNGVDDNEPGVTNVQIVIELRYPDNTTATITRTTGAGGVWSVANLPVGTSYHVCEVTPFEWLQTAPAPNSDDERCYDGVANADVTELDFGNIAAHTADGHKYYDANANGADDGEVMIGNWKFVGTFHLPDGTTEVVTLNALPDGPMQGMYWFGPYPDGTTFTICEVMPPVGNWVRTDPVASDCQNGTVTGATVTGDYDASYFVRATYMRFGNLLLGGRGGHTLGFWSNRNGKSLMTAGSGGMAGALSFLSGLNLRNADGSNFDPTTYDQYRSWLLSANATNMAYMLSAQLAAMELSVRSGLVQGSYLIYAPGTNSANALGYATVQNVMNEANTELGLHGLTTEGSAFRAYQEALKNALDNANNDLTFVMPPVSWVPLY